MIARLGGVTLSVLLHAGLIALLLAWSSAIDWTRPLFVDLVERAEAPGSPTGEPSAARPAAGAVGAASARVRASARPASIAPATSRAPASGPVPPAVAPVAPAAPPALAIAPEPLTEPAGTPAPPQPAAPAPSPLPASPAVSSTPAGPTDGRGTVADGGAGAGPERSAQTRGDGNRGAGGIGLGSPLALATPAPGGSGAAPAEYDPYLRQFRQRVQESLVYPLAARRRGLGGTVELHVWLEATGRVRDVQVARSSSHAVLDDAAVETIRRLGPVPFPESLPRRPLLIRIPLVYELR